MSADARNRILDACERVIATNGLGKFRMTAVAREAGVSIGLLSYHFGDRNGLLQAALDRVNTGSAHRADTASESHSISARLTALLCSEFGEEPQIRAGSIVWNEVRAAAVFDVQRSELLARSTDTWQRTVRELIDAARLQRGNISGIDPDLASLALTALVEGLSGRWLTGQITAAQAQDAVRAAVQTTLQTTHDCRE